MLLDQLLDAVLAEAAVAVGGEAQRAALQRAELQGYLGGVDARPGLRHLQLPALALLAPLLAEPRFCSTTQSMMSEPRSTVTGWDKASWMVLSMGCAQVSPAG